MPAAGVADSEALERRVADFLGDVSSASREIPGFQPRAQQLALAQAIAETILVPGHLIAEAGTGIGKTFAYLVPAILSGKKVLVSTATKSLQDQLFNRDLPRLLRLLGVPLSVARLKGRANYLCPYRLERLGADSRGLHPAELQSLKEVLRFSKIDPEGDVSACTTVAEGASIWPMVTSTTENCLGSKCPNWSECPVVKARERAAKAELLVVNHHLLCADFALREVGEGDLLPECDVLIIDEAHALPDIATQFFGLGLSTQMLSVFSREMLAAGLAHAQGSADWAGLAGHLEAATMQLRAAVGASSSGNLSVGRKRWSDLSPTQREELNASVSLLSERLDAIRIAFEGQGERHPELARIGDRASDLINRLAKLEPESDSLDDENLATDQQGLPGVYWIEQSRNGCSMHWAPIEVGPLLSARMRQRSSQSWIFVSATLCVAEDFSYFTDRIGLASARTERFHSPFDYERQGLLCVPEQLPDPKSNNLIEQILAEPDIQSLISSVPGGIFILCTSHRAVEQAARSMGPICIRQGRPLLVQGSVPRDALLEQFRRDGKSVLIGAQSFWEGVDVPGEALSMVLIDKLPFASPDDPILEARIQRSRAMGGDAFREIQLPSATLALKQGVGRLIRSETDRGLVLVGDKRLAETGYGRQMLRSLPSFKRTRSLSDAGLFFPKLQS
ncbi:MAG: putative ATP-dependent helicase [Pseudomonadota bacterium]|jgi:ATP-dependent DNA helicase DinG